METAPLKVFATSARTELIREVTARITAVLSQGSPERVESPATVASLEKAVAVGGGGDQGKAHVADKVAYTWFNRIIALRFMDANGYTGIGVVSPAADQVGQPEVLAAAKRGQIDQEVVSNDRTTSAIAGLLNGTRQPRPGIDAQAEAYSLLLAAYCQFWHKAMPFMFERQGDFTELLIPANLLAGDSALNRSVEVLTEDACKDVEVIGWLYQFYISELKDEVFAGFKRNKKAGVDEIAAATQLFTPHWIVRYLVENSLGRLWMLNRPGSSLVDQMDYYIASVDGEVDFLKIATPEELTIIDPACGSGHMLTYAFDLLYSIYEEEGYAPSEIPGLIIANNLYGTEIDPRAGALAAFALTMKARQKQRLFFNKSVRPNICVVEPVVFDSGELEFLVASGDARDPEINFWKQFENADIRGSLIRPDRDIVTRASRLVGDLDDRGDAFHASTVDRAERLLRQAKFLTRRYAVAIANPPYMGNRNIVGPLSEFAKAEYPNTKPDLFAMFIERCIALAQPLGRVAMVTMQSWMFLSTYKALRARLISDVTLTSMAHLGTNAFDSISGEVVGTTAFCIARQHERSPACFIDLRSGRSEREKSSELRDAVRARRWFVVAPERFRVIDGSPFAYWLPDRLWEVFEGLPPLGTKLKTAVGLNTGDNGRFVRLWHEVSFNRIGIGNASLDEINRSGRKWIPYNKGGGHRKWYGNQSFVINWENDGRELKEFATQRNSGRHWSRYIQNLDVMAKECLTWPFIATSAFSARYCPAGFLFDVGGPSGIPGSDQDSASILALMCSSLMPSFMSALNPTVNFQVGDLARVPYKHNPEFGGSPADLLPVQIARSDWDAYERSWNFGRSPLLSAEAESSSVERELDRVRRESSEARHKLQKWEEAANQNLADAYGLSGLVPTAVPIADITLTSNPYFTYGEDLDAVEARRLETSDYVRELVSYAVGCMFGRYSLDKPGLILADQGASLKNYFAEVPTPSFTPDEDNVVPVVDGDWFEDDIVERLRRFLRISFGESNFERNLNFVTKSLGVKNLREYFVTKAGKSKFYDDHVQRYKKRPIYWLFSSPKGSFNALIYLHRYTPSTASTVLTYLREYVTKLESSLQQAERAGNAKEADRLRKILVELNEYEHDTLYPKASENVVIDLDDGVKVNYPKLGGALRKISGLESSGE